MIVAKEILPDQYLIIEDDGKKIGTLSKEKKGWSLIQKGQKIQINDISRFKKTFEIPALESTQRQITYKNKNQNGLFYIYDYPCCSEPHEPVFNIKKKLPIFSKSNKSKSLYCAGYYLVKFRKGWVKSFSPKLITLERYPFKGPFKNEAELKAALTNLQKNETT